MQAVLIDTARAYDNNPCELVRFSGEVSAFIEGYESITKVFYGAKAFTHLKLLMEYEESDSSNHIAKK